MKNFLIALLFLPLVAFAQKTPQGVTYDAQILRITDGDTVVIAAPFLPAPLKPELALQRKVSVPNAKVKNNVAKPHQLLLRMPSPKQPHQVVSFKLLCMGGTSLEVVYLATF